MAVISLSRPPGAESSPRRSGRRVTAAPPPSFVSMKLLSVETSGSFPGGQSGEDQARFPRRVKAWRLLFKSPIGKLMLSGTAFLECVPAETPPASCTCHYRRAGAGEAARLSELSPGARRPPLQQRRRHMFKQGERRHSRPREEIRRGWRPGGPNIWPPRICASVSNDAARHPSPHQAAFVGRPGSSGRVIPPSAEDSETSSRHRCWDACGVGLQSRYRSKDHQSGASGSLGSFCDAEIGRANS